jgi:hypothetical protein
MFTSEQAALIFMDQCRVELRRNCGALLISDAEVYWDAVRGREVLRGVPGTSLELAACLLVSCRSSKEKRGGSFAVEADRLVEIESRAWLGLENAGKRTGCGAREMVRKLIWKFLESEAEKMRKEQRKLEKLFGWWEEPLVSEGGGEGR